MIQGYAVHAAGAELHPYKYDPGDLGPFDVDVAVHHCAVSRADASLIDHEWGISQYPFIPGHEIVGVVTAVGAGVQQLSAGQRVGIGWQADSCGHCNCCLRGWQQLCAGAVLTCVGRNGGFAEHVRVNARFAAPLPDTLAGETAAPLMAAGTAVYAAFRAHGVHPGSRVGVLGIGGMGHLALQFARVFGAEVVAFSSSADKEEQARRLGAHTFVNTRETKSLKVLAGTFDLVLSTASVALDWTSYLQVLRPHGVLALAGRTGKAGTLALAPGLAAPRQVVIAGGPGPVMLAEMLQVAARHGIAAVVESFPMRDANEAVVRTRKGKVRFRAVLSN